MSGPSKDLTFPRKVCKGANPKMQSVGTINNNTIAWRIADAIRPYSDKHLAKILGANPLTIKNHRQGLNAPSAATLINLMRENDDVFHAVLDMAQRSPASSDAHQQKLEQIMNILGSQNRAINPNRIPSAD